MTAQVEQKFKLISSDQEEIEISDTALHQSTTLSNLFGTGIVSSGDVSPIPVNNIKGEHLRMIVEWCEHHKKDPIPEEDDDSSKKVEISEWDTRFLLVDNETLYQIICAANYLDIKQLINVSCKTVALMAKDRTPEELRIIFGIPTKEEAKNEEKKNGGAEETKVESGQSSSSS